MRCKATFGDGRPRVGGPKKEATMVSVRVWRGMVDDWAGMGLCLLAVIVGKDC